MASVITGKQVAAVLRKARRGWRRLPQSLGVLTASKGNARLAFMAWFALEVVTNRELRFIVQAPPAFVEDAFAAAIELANG